MSDAFRSPSNSSSPADLGSGRAVRGLLRLIGYLGIAGALGVMAYTTIAAMQDRAVMQDSVDHLTEMRGLVQPVQKHLAPEYTDTDGDLLADLPRDAANLLDPDTLVLAHYVDADVETQLVDWDALQAALAQATGKKILLQEYQNSADDVAAVKAGSIQLVALHAADAPYIVNNAGFIPVAVLGTEAGGARQSFGHRCRRQEQDSDAGRYSRSQADVHGTGFDDGLSGRNHRADAAGRPAPDVDYSINFSLGQKRSVLGLINGEFSIAALSDDKVESMLKNGSLKASDYRVIYQSEVIPRLTIGYVYDLEPNLATKVTAAALDFANEGGSPDESTGQPMHFVPIDYKKDFEFVRTVDNSFDPRFFKGTKPAPARAGRPTGE